jgi:hypothetical protein
MGHLGTDLIKNFDLLTLEAKYNESINLIDQAFAKFEMLESNFKTFFSEEYSVLPHDFGQNRSNNLKKIITKSAWRFVVNKMQIENFIPAKKREELRNKIEKNEMPEFSAMNIGRFVTDAAMNINSLIQESAKEVYSFIKPNTGHKTNEYAKGMPPKVILTWIVDTNFNYNKKPWLYSRAKDRLKDLDNIFNLLDGKGAVKYPGDLCTKIESSEDGLAETTYFKCKWYGNGNLHIEFKRMDLANKLAELATNNILHN